MNGLPSRQPAPSIPEFGQAAATAYYEKQMRSPRDSLVPSMSDRATFSIIDLSRITPLLERLDAVDYFLAETTLRTRLRRPVPAATLRRLRMAGRSVDRHFAHKALTALAGLLPASAASRKDPVEALRSE